MKASAGLAPPSTSGGRHAANLLRDRRRRESRRHRGALAAAAVLAPLARDRVALVARSAVIVLLVLVAIFAPLIVKLVGAPEPERAGRRRRSTTSARRPGPSRDHLVRRRRARPRRLLARRLRRARLARGRVHRHRASRCSIGVVVGMFAGYYRGWVDTVLSRVDRRRARVPDPAARARPRRRRARGGDGCLGGLAQARASAVVIFVIAFVNWTYIARIIRGQVLSLREQRVRRGRALARRLRPPHHLPRDPAQPRRADHRLRDAADPAEHPLRGGAVVPRRRRPAADASAGAR